MTDKVQKIRNEVEKLKSNLMYGACSSQVAMETRCKEEAYNEVLAILDTMQEEPASEDLEEVGKEWLRPQLDKSYEPYGERKMMELTRFDGYTMLDAVEFGAKWHKGQLMAKAVDVTIAIPYQNGYGGYTHLVDSQEALPFGENIKVLVIKED